MDQIIQEIVKGKEELIYKGFEMYGFDKKYLEDHASDFELLVDQVTGYERYLYKGKHLFTLKIDMDHGGFKVYMFLDFIDDYK